MTYNKEFRLAASEVLDQDLMKELNGPQAAFLSASARDTSSRKKGVKPRKQPRGGSMVVRWSGTCHKFNRQDGVCQYGSKCRFDRSCARFGGPHSELDSPAVEQVIDGTQP